MSFTVMVKVVGDGMLVDGLGVKPEKKALAWGLQGSLKVD